MGKLRRNIFAYVLGVYYKFINIFKRNCHIGSKLRIFNNSELRIYSGARCKIGNNVKIDYNTVISSLKNSNLEIGDNVGIGANSMIVCHNKITIGEGTIMGPGVYIYDHDHKFSKNKVSRKEYKCAEVTIGKNCWIGAGSIILKGTNIGDNCVIGAGTLLKGNYPSQSLIITERKTLIKKIMDNEKGE